MLGKSQIKPAKIACHRRYLVAGLVAFSAPGAAAQSPVVSTPLPFPATAETSIGAATHPLGPVVLTAGAAEVARRDRKATEDALESKSIKPSVKRASTNRTRQEQGWKTPTLPTKNQQTLAPHSGSKLGVDHDAVGKDTTAPETSATAKEGLVDMKQSELAELVPLEDDAVGFTLSDSPGKESFANPSSVGVVSPLVGSAVAPTLEDANATPKKMWKGESPVSTGQPAPAPKLTKMPALGRILPVPVADPLRNEPSEVAMPTPAVKNKPIRSEVAEALIVNGARPKVAVSKPPIAIERVIKLTPDWLKEPARKTDDVVTTPVTDQGLTKAEPKASAEPTEAPTESETKLPSTPASGSTPKVTDRSIGGDPESMVAKTADHTAELIGQIRLRPTEVRSIKLPGKVQAIRSSAPRTCTVLVTTAGQMQVIATGEGIARLTLELCEEGSLPNRLVAYEVQVDRTPANVSESHESIAQKLTETIRLTFPSTNAEIRCVPAGLEVVGNCPDENTAKQLLRMVRSACPLAINDRLTVR
jgi:hypothetical protein